MQNNDEAHNTNKVDRWAAILLVVLTIVFVIVGASKREEKTTHTILKNTSISCVCSFQPGAVCSHTIEEKKEQKVNSELLMVDYSDKISSDSSEEKKEQVSSQSPVINKTEKTNSQSSKKLNNEKKNESKTSLSVTANKTPKTKKENKVIKTPKKNKYAQPKKIKKAENKKNNGNYYTEKFTLTFYCTCSKCCGKSTGITASGAKAVPGVTIAASSKYKFGTKMDIDGFGTRIVQDRGGAVNGNKIDVLVGSHSQAYKLGVKRNVSVKIYK